MTTANAEQYAAWNGESGQRWVASADRRDAVLAPIADLLCDRAAIAAGERVLDIGCGCGATALAAAAAAGPSGWVVGVDLSTPMLDVARRRAEGRRNTEFRHADAQTDPLGGPFDVAISRFGTMFFDNPIAAFSNIVRHLAPGGRLCIATWQPLATNQWLVVPGAALLDHGTLPDGTDSAGPGMFAQSDPATIRSILTRADLTQIASEPLTVPLTFGTTLEDAVDYLADSGPGQAVLDTIPPSRRGDALTAVRHALARHHDPDRGVVLDAAVWVTTATTPLGTDDAF
jgi:SAM-dependent methyltransferase